MAKAIVIQQPSWLERHPVQIRRLLVRLIFSEATELGWDIVMHGQRWDQDTADFRKQSHKQQEPMTDEEWRLLMGPQAA
jgi:hypothetical protein